jgi:cytochrome c oxidase assembly protein subunit 15
MRGFYRLAVATLIAVYFLILVGGIVRATGSGMGCPDWPRCFGKWVPPTSVDQLPHDYKEQLSALRNKKNQKFARYLIALGMKDTAEKLVNDQSILKEADFNVQKTWIEYINRLVGVAIGLFIIALVIMSFRLMKIKPILFWMSLSTLILVIFQGWFGSIVVSTNLTPWTITIHMFLALVIVAILIAIVHRTHEPAPIQVSGTARLLLTACMIVLLIQTFLGTEVRSAIDRLTFAGESRQNWLAMIGTDFIIHRSFSWVVLILHIALLWTIRQSIGINLPATSLAVLILATLLSGIGMAYQDVPAFLQPLHLLMATATFGVQFYLFLQYRSKYAIATV